MVEDGDLRDAVRAGLDRLIFLDADARLHLLTYETLSAHHARIGAIEAQGDLSRRVRFAYVAPAEEHQVALRLHAALLETRRGQGVEVLVTAEDVEARAWLASPR